MSMSRPLRGLRPRVRRGARASAACSPSRARATRRLPADARRGARASTGAPDGCSLTPGSDDTRRSASSSPRAASRATSSRTSCCRWSSAVWSAAPQTRAGLPGPLPLRVPRQPRDARGHRLAALAHGRRRLAHATSSGAAKDLTAVRTATPVRARHARRRRAWRSATTRRRRPRFDARGRRHPRRPGAAAARRPDRRASAPCSGAFRYSRNATLLHTDTVGAAARPRRAGVVELPACPSLRRRRRPASGVSYDMNRLQRLADAATTTWSRSTAPTASTRDRVIARCTTSTRSTRRSRSPRNGACPS